MRRLIFSELSLSSTFCDLFWVFHLLQNRLIFKIISQVGDLAVPCSSDMAIQEPIHGKKQLEPEWINNHSTCLQTEAPLLKSSLVNKEQSSFFMTVYKLPLQRESEQMTDILQVEWSSSEEGAFLSWHQFPFRALVWDSLLQMQLLSSSLMKLNLLAWQYGCLSQ